MKRLKVTDENGRAYRLNVSAWVLLSRLLDRIPSRSLVSILSEHRLLKILHNVLVDLNAVSQSSKLNRIAVDNEQTPANNKTKSKKRKHSEVEESDQLSPLVGSPCDILIAVASFIRKYLSLPARLPDNQFVLGSQIKLVLRGDPDTISKILGLTFHEATVSVSRWRAESNGPSIRQLLSSLTSVLELWDNRAVNTKQPGPVSSNVSWLSFADMIFQHARLTKSTGSLLCKCPPGGVGFSFRYWEASGRRSNDSRADRAPGSTAFCFPASRFCPSEDFAL